MEQEKGYKIIEQNNDYKLLEWLFNDIPITIRSWANGKVEIRLNENFALANGYLTLKSMLAACALKRGVGNIGFYNTDWVRVDNDGNFYLQGAIKVKSVALPVVGNDMSIN